MSGRAATDSGEAQIANIVDYMTAPGHQFEPHEAEQLSQTIEFALQLGWDALVAAKPGRQLLLLSHDDRIEIYRGFEWRLLAEKLIALGSWHR